MDDPTESAHHRGLLQKTVLRWIEGWLRSSHLTELAREFGEQPPSNASLPDLISWLESYSSRWDYRGGKERNLVEGVQFEPAREAIVLAAAEGLGLTGTAAPPNDDYDHILVLGGLVRACLARPLHAATLIRQGEVAAGTVTALGGFRPLGGDEHDLAASAGYPDLADEFEAMDAGLRRAFALADPIDERGERSEVVGASWCVRQYRTDEGLDVRVIAAPSSEPGVRRANTPDTYIWFAEQVAKLQPGQRVLLVTTDIYVVFQHAAAIERLSLPYGVEVDAVGIQAGAIDSRLAQPFRPDNYLQEVRSSILALGNLHRALIRANQV